MGKPITEYPWIDYTDGITHDHVRNPLLRTGEEFERFLDDWQRMSRGDGYAKQS